MINPLEIEPINLLGYEDVVIVDNKGIIVFDDLANLSLYDLRPDEMIGKKVTSLYSNLNDENSIFMQVLRTGIPVLNEKQELTTKENNAIFQISSTFPIMSGAEIVGAVEFSKFLYKTDSMHLIKKASPHKVFRKNNTIYTIDDIVTANPAMQAIKDRLHRIAKTDSTVLIYGKTGTGKELIAQAIHNLSDRCHKPFISQNCAAIPTTLLEGILFGTVKGSFTGAEDHKGLFEQAEGGTLFLDEINSMDIGIQVKILKAIEEKTIRRVGGSKNINLNVRILSALNEDPEKAIEARELREDLYYRLNTVNITLPVLCERKEDIRVLAEHYIEMYNSAMAVPVQQICPEVFAVFEKYSWPGNIRELRNVIESFYNQMDDSGIITIEAVSEKIRAAGTVGATAIAHRFDAANSESLKDAVADYEKNLIRSAMEEAHGIAAIAARTLKLSKQAMQYKLDKYDLHINDKRRGT